MTLRELVTQARQRLEAAGIPPPEAALDAELLARHALAWDRATWVARQREEPPPSFEPEYAALVERRRRREPIAHIRGQQEFYGREFRVSPAALIPRPETELLVEEALLLLPALGFSRALTVIDIGTGSGCLAITLALEYPRARYFATDVSPEALEVARDNAARLGAGGRVEFVCGSYFAGLPGPFNLIVSNPPYIAETDREALAAEVAQYDPPAALFAGADGLRDLRAILSQSTELLDEDGTLLMEMGYDQAERVAALADETERLAMVRTRRDLQGIPRVAVIRRCR